MATLLLWTCTQTAWATEELHLLGRSTVPVDELSLSPALRPQGPLRVGISDPDYPPFDITNHAHEFEGISADYLGLIGQLLKVEVQIQRYPDRESVIQALKRGDIDLLTSANDFEADDPDLQLTLPYLRDKPVLLERNHTEYSIDPAAAGKTIAMVNHYLPLSTVKRHYPAATFELYPSIVAAVSAVAFSKADLYLGDSTSAGYLINKSYLNNVQVVDYPSINVSPFSFAVTRRNAPLLQSLNAALQAIPASEQLIIARRWNASDASITGAPHLQFTPQEQTWLATHPQLKVVANEDFLPFSFFNEHQRLWGLSADILAKISQRTGLKFIPQKSQSINEMVYTVSQNDADLVAALAPSPEREQQVSFSRPYSVAPLVLVTRIEADSPRDLGDLPGKRLVIISGNSLQAMIEQQYPGIQIVTAQNLRGAFSMVSEGDADAAISILTSAQYLISHTFGALKVASTVAGSSAQIAFAVNHNAPLLLSILNKSLLSIPPEEMDEINNRWRSPMVTDSYWVKHRTTILQGFAISAALLALAGLWIVQLRREVRKRKIAERALNDRLKFERVLIDGTPHPLYIRDKQGCLLACNNAYLNALGLTSQSVHLGETVIQSALIGDAQTREYHQDYLRAMADNQPQIRDRRLVLPNGEVRTIHHWILPYQSNDGGVDGLIGGWLDVSDRQQLMDQLQAAKHQADKANSAKTVFLSTMSHEIRTPMNAILGMLEMASKKAGQGVLDLTAIDIASEASRGLLALIGDILDISRIESGHDDLLSECENPHRLLTSLVKVFDGLARQKTIQLVTDIEASVDRYVMIDALRFKQVIANLLSNAIKFTDVGEVRINAAIEPLADPQWVRLHVIIEDSGVGISHADQQRLFTPFTQVGNPATGTGSGLGLAISRALVEAMGGTLQLSSEEAIGTQVILALDLLASTSPAVPVPVASDAEDALPPSSAALSVLIVDDYAINRMVLTQQLIYLGHRVQEAADGEQALTLWRKEPFDVVITDCNMPGMSGYELARTLRQDEQQRGDPGCLLLGFTASAVPEERQRCLNAGMNDCLFKPVNLQQLNERLAPLQAAYFCDEDSEALSWGMIERHLNTYAFGNPVVLQNLKTQLATNTRADIDLLAELVQSRDRDALAEFAHRIKGGARLINFERLIIGCESLRVLCEREGALAGLEDAAGMLDECLRELAGCLHTPSPESRTYQ